MLGDNPLMLPNSVAFATKLLGQLFFLSQCILPGHCRVLLIHLGQQLDTIVAHIPVRLVTVTVILEALFGREACAAHVQTLQPRIVMWIRCPKLLVSQY